MSAGGTASTSHSAVHAVVISWSTIDASFRIETGSFGTGFLRVVIAMDMVVIIVIGASSRLPKNGLLGATTFPRGSQDGVGIVGR